MNKEICIFFCFFVFLLLRVSQKALQLPVLLFFFFVLSSVFLNDPTSIFCTFDCCMYLWQYPPTHLRKLCGERSIDLKRFAQEYYMPCALEKIMMAEASCSICKTVYEEVICDTCDP